MSSLYSCIGRLIKGRSEFRMKGFGELPLERESCYDAGCGKRGPDPATGMADSSLPFQGSNGSCKEVPI